MKPITGSIFLGAICASSFWAMATMQLNSASGPIAFIAAMTTTLAIVVMAVKDSFP